MTYKNDCKLHHFQKDFQKILLSSLLHLLNLDKIFRFYLQESSTVLECS